MPCFALCIAVQAYNLSDTSCLLEWSIDNTADVSGFSVTRAVVHGRTPAVSVTLPPTARQHLLVDLDAATEYTLCLTVHRRREASSSGGDYACTSVWTASASEPLTDDEYRRMLTVILASMFAGTILLAVAATVIILVWRCRRGRPRRKAVVASNVGLAAAQKRTSRPQIGYL